MLLIRTSAGERRLLNPDCIMEIRPKPEGLGSEITLRNGTVIATDTQFPEFATDLGSRKFTSVSGR